MLTLALRQALKISCGSISSLTIKPEISLYLQKVTKAQRKLQLPDQSLNQRSPCFSGANPIFSFNRNEIATCETSFHICQAVQLPVSYPITYQVFSNSQRLLRVRESAKSQQLNHSSHMQIRGVSENHTGSIRFCLSTLVRHWVFITSSNSSMLLLKQREEYQCACAYIHIFWMRRKSRGHDIWNTSTFRCG